jgi:hypothetical protein
MDIVMMLTGEGGRWFACPAALFSSPPSLQPAIAPAMSISVNKGPKRLFIGVLMFGGQDFSDASWFTAHRLCVILPRAAL